MSEIEASSPSEGVADPVGRVPAEESADGGHNFSTFYQATWNDVAAALTLALGSDQLATDAAAEGFVRAYERWSTVSQMSNPSGWVYPVSLNWARSWIRRRSTERRRQERLRDGTIDDLPDPDLERALATLSPQQRDVVILRFFLGLTVLETADALGVAAGTVKSRLSRALRDLHHELTDTSQEVPRR